ncbi:hypothetical protein GCM10027091_00430 [Streptomyces daliensis]
MSLIAVAQVVRESVRFAGFTLRAGSDTHWPQSQRPRCRLTAGPIRAPPLTATRKQKEPLPELCDRGSDVLWSVHEWL